MLGGYLPPRLKKKSIEKKSREKSNNLCCTGASSSTGNGPLKKDNEVGLEGIGVAGKLSVEGRWEILVRQVHKSREDVVGKVGEEPEQVGWG